MLRRSRWRAPPECVVEHDAIVDAVPDRRKEGSSGLASQPAPSQDVDLDNYRIRDEDSSASAPQVGDGKRMERVAREQRSYQGSRIGDQRRSRASLSRYFSEFRARSRGPD